jgi:DNA-binding transcriptional LysR family regulator
MSQPALSMSLRRLERMAGSKVVQRTPKGVELTDAGAALLKHVRRLRPAHEDILREVRDIAHGRGGHIRAGTSFGVSDLRLVTACGRLLNEAPQVTVAITGASPSELFSSLRAGDLDFMMGSARGPETDDFTQERWIEEEFVPFCSRRHRLARLKRVTWADLASQKWAENSSRLATLFAARGLPPPQVVFTSAHPKHHLRIVGATDLLGLRVRSLVERSAKRLGLVVLHVVDWTPVQRLNAIMYRKDAYLSPATRRLIELVKETV